MGFRFRKSIKIAPGVKINLNKKSASVSIGTKGMRKTYSTTGRKTTTVGLPGTGISYSTSSGSKKSTSKKLNQSKSKVTDVDFNPPPQTQKKRFSRLKIAITLWVIAGLAFLGSFSSSPDNLVSGMIGVFVVFLIGLYFYKTKDKYKDEEVQNEIIETQTEYSDDEDWTDAQDLNI